MNRINFEKFLILVFGLFLQVCLSLVKKTTEIGFLNNFSQIIEKHNYWAQLSLNSTLNLIVNTRSNPRLHYVQFWVEFLVQYFTNSRVFKNIQKGWKADSKSWKTDCALSPLRNLSKKPVNSVRKQTNNFSIDSVNSVFLASTARGLA